MPPRREASSAAEIGKMLGAVRSGQYWKCKCPAHDDRSPSLSIWTDKDDGHTAFYCWAGCDWRDVREALIGRGALIPGKRKQQDGAPPPRDPQLDADEAEREAKKLRLVKAIWEQAQTCAGTRVLRYLSGRGLDLPPELDGRVVRYHPTCPRVVGKVPAMLVAMRDPLTGAGVGIQRIFLSPLGERQGDKMMLGHAGMAMLDRPGPQLHVCEGFETALALYLDGKRPVWAAMMAGKLERFPLIDGVNHLIAHLDNDASGTGWKAGAKLCGRWHEAGRTVDLFMTDREGTDYADVVRARHG